MPDDSVAAAAALALSMGVAVDGSFELVGRGEPVDPAEHAAKWKAQADEFDDPFAYFQGLRDKQMLEEGHVDPETLATIRAHTSRPNWTDADQEQLQRELLPPVETYRVPLVRPLVGMARPRAGRAPRGRRAATRRTAHGPPGRSSDDPEPPFLSLDSPPPYFREVELRCDVLARLDAADRELAAGNVDDARTIAAGLREEWSGWLADEGAELGADRREP